MTPGPEASADGMGEVHARETEERRVAEIRCGVCARSLGGEWEPLPEGEEAWCQTVWCGHDSDLWRRWHVFGDGRAA